MADGGAGARHLAGMRPAIGVACAAYAFCVAMLGSTPPTPLYPIYQQRLGYGHLLTTVVLAVYAGGVIVALLLFGRASDLLGRRPILLVGLAVSALSTGGFLIVGGVPELLAARLPSDVSVGLVTATATVALVEPVRPRRRTAAALPAAVVNMFGLGCGPAGLLAEYGPRPLRMPFAVDLVLPAAAMVAVLLMPETVRTRTLGRPRPQRPAIAAEAPRCSYPRRCRSAARSWSAWARASASAPGSRP